LLQEKEKKIVVKRVIELSRNARTTFHCEDVSNEETSKMFNEASERVRNTQAGISGSSEQCRPAAD